MSNKEIIIYQTKSNREPLNDWLDDIKDVKTRTRILTRLDRLEQGHYGDYKSVGEGVSELRFFFGSGYRVYFSEVDDAIILLLCAGDKDGQKRDIKTAQNYWKDYQENFDEMEEDV